MQVDVQYIPITAKISGKNPSGLASFWNLNSMVEEKSNLDCIYGLRKDYNKTLVVMQINDSCMNEIYKEVLFPFFFICWKAPPDGSIMRGISNLWWFSLQYAFQFFIKFTLWLVLQAYTISMKKVGFYKGDV